MDFTDISALARESRELYRLFEQRKYGQEWGPQDLLVGFVGDVGDLSQLMGAYAGIRPGPEDLKAAIAHELADCLWSILTLSQALDIDLEEAFLGLHDELIKRVTKKLAELDG